jgi:hypothetical protein
MNRRELLEQGVLVIAEALASNGGTLSEGVN